MTTVKEHTVHELLDVQPFRELCEARVAAGDTWSQIARRCGWFHAGKPNSGASSQLRRRLGYLGYGRRKHRDNTEHRQLRISYDNATRIVRACGADPVEFGL